MTPAELDHVCRKYRGACVSWAASLVPQRVAEDVAQEALVTLANRAHSVPRDAAWPFLREAVRRHGLAAWRKLAAEVPVDSLPEEESIDDAETTLTSAQESAALLAAIAALPESRRRPIVDVIGNDAPVSEVAKRERIPESTLRSRMDAGLDDVRAALSRREATAQRKAGFRSWGVALLAAIDPRAVWKRIKIWQAAGRKVAVLLGATGAAIAVTGGAPAHIEPVHEAMPVRVAETEPLRFATPLPVAERGHDVPVVVVKPRATHDAGARFRAAQFRH